MKNNQSPFSASVMALFLTCAVALFALSILLRAYGGPVSSVDITGPNTYSTSAIGYAGIYDTLRRLDWQVTRSTGNSLALVGTNGTLIVAEPNLERLAKSYGRIKILNAPRLLFVLPKWSGTQDLLKETWISKAESVSLDLAQKTLDLVTEDGKVFRSKWPKPWQINKLGSSPSYFNRSGGVQLIKSAEMRPIIGNDDGMLVGELLGKNKRKIWVLADPDVLSNHGLVKGSNIVFALALIDQLSKWENDDPNAPIIFDETVHGFNEAQGSPIRLLFRFPFVVVTILAVITTVLLLLAGTSRFGAPILPPPELDFGKASLINNGARLLDQAGHQAITFRRYVRMIIHVAARNLHAPNNLDEQALTGWLDHIGESRGIAKSCGAIWQSIINLDASDSKNLPLFFQGARDIYRWKEEILHGPSRSRRNR